jgi:hypothetical protein
MPRTRKTELVSASSPVTKAKKIVKKPVKKIEPKVGLKAEPKKAVVSPVKKAKPVIIDVIEDDDGESDVVNSSNFFSDASLAKSDFLAPRSNTQNDEENTYVPIKRDEQQIVNDEPTIIIEDTDIQKKFFSDLVSEIKTKNENAGALFNDRFDLENKKPITAPKKSLGLYRRLAWKFLIMVGLLALLVLYFSFSKLTILITPEVEKMSDTLFMKVSGEMATTTEEINDSREKVSGSVNEVEIEVEKKYEATGEESLGENLSGKVIIVNNYIKSQQLIATTRLLSSDNKLFRIKEAVNIPAGGKVEVEIYADEISADMAIPPSHFTIPGLWVGLQDKIYAESETAFTYGKKLQRYVTDPDIQSAKQDINALILKKAEESKSLRVQDEVLYQVLESSDIQVSAKAGDKVSEFTLRAKTKVAMVSFSKEEAARLASAKLNILVPDDKELAEFKSENLVYTFENYDEKNKTASIKASFYGFMILKSNANIIDRSRLVNLNAEQIDAYLGDYPEIGNYELQFYPSFVKRAPNLVDRIEVKIKN